jgi:23S rRNA pseudouridine2457 synthase
VKLTSKESPLRYVLFNKPYGVLSQFTPEDGARSLAEFSLPKELYPAGRLDKDSEGLLLLTNDGPLIHRLLEPKYDKEKTYWVQIERVPTRAALQTLAGGVKIQDYHTLPCEVRLIDDPLFPPREPPIRVRLTVPDCWIEIKLKEGKNRQVRKMTAAIGHPTLRLVRVAIGHLKLENLAPGEWREIERPALDL